MKNSIRKWLIGPLLGFCVLPIVVLGVILSWENFRIEKQYVMEMHQRFAVLAADNISLFLHEQEMRLHALLQSTGLASLPALLQEEELAMFLSTTKDNVHGHVFDNLSLLNPQGMETVRVSVNDVVLLQDLQDLSTSDEFLVPYVQGVLYYSPVYYDTETGEPFLKISIPARDIRTNAINGVLVAETKLKFMWRLVENLRMGRNGTAFITDGTGRVVAHPNRSIILRNSYFEVPAYSRIMQGVMGQEAVVAAEKIHFANQTMHFVVEVNTREALRHINRSVQIIVTFLVLMLIGAVALGIIIIQRIAKPIEDLAHTAEAITSGDLKRRADEGRNDELGELAKAFNSMTARLLETITKYRQERNLLKNAIDSLTHPFYLIDANDFTIRLANKAANLEGLTEQSTCHKMTHHLDSPCDNMGHRCPLLEIKKTGQPVLVEHVHYGANGTPKIHEVYGYPIFDQEGRVEQVIEYVIDISEKKVVEEQLRQAHEAGMAAMAAEVLHNIGNVITPAKISAMAIHKHFEDSLLKNNLVSTLKEFMEMFQAAPSVPEDEKRRFARIVELLPAIISEDFDYCLEEIENIIDKHRHIEDVISLQSSYSRLPGIFEKLDINRLVEDALQMQGEILNKYGIQVTKEFGNLPETRGERARLIQILINLIKNAQEATVANAANDRHMTITTAFSEDRPPMLMISVKDNGCGLSPGEQEKLFSFGFTTKKTGSGFGLHFCANYLIANNGAIRAQSAGKGQGACFEVKIPVVES